MAIIRVLAFSLVIGLSKANADYNGIHSAFSQSSKRFGSTP